MYKRTCGITKIAVDFPIAKAGCGSMDPHVSACDKVDFQKLEMESQGIYISPYYSTSTKRNKKFQEFGVRVVVAEK